MLNRRANAVMFGFDFQVNAAIVLMLENIKELQFLRLESKNEEIDIQLVSGNHILAQAKAVENSSRDFKNVRKNLEKALISLSEGYNNISTDKLIFITNSPDPLNEDSSKSIFYGHSHRAFSSLPKSSQEIIKNYLKKIKQPLNTKQFSIQVLPFETDEEKERYKVVLSVINDFIGDIHLSIPGLGKQLHEIWLTNIFKNGSKKNDSIVLKKKDLIWPIIVISTNIDFIDSDFIDRFDTVLYEEIANHYRETINSCCERVDFFTKVLFDFNNYKSISSMKEKSLNFTEENWKNYVTEFSIEGIDDDTLEGLTKIIIYSIIRRRYDTDRIKSGVNL